MIRVLRKKLVHDRRSSYSFFWALFTMIDDGQRLSGVRAPRIVSQFSCGAASAVATKLVLADYPPERVVILRAWIKEEHEDNDRFSADCERWFGHPIIVLRDEKYGASAIEVFRRNRYLKGRLGAPCRQALKGDVLEAASLPDDIWVLGYTAEEEDRLDEFLDANNGRKVICPLIGRNLTKADCLAMVERAGIELPMMYRLGYNNNNCRCCVKGGEGYFNRQRIDFPEHFAALADVQESIGPGAYLFRDRKTGERYSLRNLPPGKGRHKEPEISCSVFCTMAEEDIDQRGDGRIRFPGCR
jgi:hypothetical protein